MLDFYLRGKRLIFLTRLILFFYLISLIATQGLYSYSIMHPFSLLIFFLFLKSYQENQGLLY